MNEATTSTRTTHTIVRTWFNGFAQTCYELENGTVITVGYSQDVLTIIEPPKTKKEL